MRSPRLTRSRVALGIVLVLGLTAGTLLTTAWTAMGTAPEGARLERMQASPQHSGDVFVNELPMVMGNPMKMTWEWIAGGGSYREPASAPATLDPTAVISTPPASGLRVTWLGHSTLLVQIDGQTILTDPVWSERASPWSYLGPKRFFAPPLPLAELPPIDAVVISHDHYDHLDAPTIRALASAVPRFLVPLGVGAHLEYWGVEASRIEEYDWWQEAAVGDVRVVCTPARHFSGRGLTDKDRTLWASWAFVGPQRRAYFSGDSGMQPAFAEIGERLGPFDISMLEVGAYDRMWADVHMGPEQALRAHELLRADVLLPVHWGTFNLALHNWTEPMERLLAGATRQRIHVATPRPGGSVEAGSRVADRWWPELPWQAADDHSVVSSHLPPTLGAALPEPG